MQSTNIPSKIPLPFAYAASSGYVNTIPVASQIGITNGKASLTDGFPPLTFQAISAGGVPPFGADFNGILNEITAIQQWQQAGGFFFYDSTFLGVIGGYPKGAILQSTSFAGLWMSSIENNTTNPDAGGAGWVSLTFEGLTSVAMSSSTVALTQLQSAYPIVKVTGTLTAGSNLIFPAIVGEWIVVNNTSGAYTLTGKTASGTGVTLTQSASTYVYGDGTNIYFADSAKVASFNSRVGAVTLNALDVTSALGFTPIPSTYKFGLGISGETWNQVSKSVNTTYTNPYSYPISVNVSFGDTLGTNPTLVIYVNGTAISTVNFDEGDFFGTTQASFIVPPGQTYQVYNSVGQNPNIWAELY